VFTLGAGYLDPGEVLLTAGLEAWIRPGCEALLELRRGPRPAESEHLNERDLVVAEAVERGAVDVAGAGFHAG
jgi:hypothetical protein